MAGVLLAMVLLCVAAIAPHPAYATSKKSYAILYHLNGGKQPADQVTRVKKGKSLRVSKIKTPKRSGYTFEGWYTNKKLTKKAKSVSGVAKKSKRRLYAKWKRITYKIVYHLNGGTRASGLTKRVNKGSTIKVSKLGKPTRVGYVFKGWYTDVGLTKKASKVSGVSAKSKRTLYARWKPVAYPISYHLDDGVLPDGAPSSYTIEQEVTLQDPSRAYHSFIGWYFDAGLTQRVETIPAGSCGAVEVYARWKPRHFTAHRGYHVEAPDNSIAAYEAAAEKGFVHVETDVRFTSDGVPVLSHDATIRVWDDVEPKDDALEQGQESVQNEAQCEDEVQAQKQDGETGLVEAQEERSQVAWTISAHSYEELCARELVVPTGPDGQGIATFEQFLGVCSTHGFRFCVDVKAGTRERVIGLVERVDSCGLTDVATWTTGNHTLLGYLAACNETIPLDFYSSPMTEAKLNKVLNTAAGHPLSVSTNINKVTPAVVARCKAAGVPLGVYGVPNETYATQVDPYVHALSIDGLVADKAPQAF